MKRIARPSERRACRRINRRLTSGSRKHLSPAGHRRAFMRSMSCRLFSNDPSPFATLP